MSDFPAELQSVNSWICHAKKVPKNPRTGRNCTGGQSSTETWGTDFETAKAAVTKFGFDGLGFVFKSSEPFVGIDLDNCIDTDGTVAGWAQRCVDEFASYTEKSPSGHGLHIIIRSEQLVSYKKHPIEVYSNKRYFTMTGERVTATFEVNNWQGGDIIQVLQVHLRDQMCETPFTDDQMALTECEIDRIVVRAKKSGNGKKFDGLWAGMWEEEYSSQSEADLALCAILAFHTNNNRLQIDQLFRRSGLFRKKWDRMAGNNRTYGQGTIERCLSNHDEQQPPLPPVEGYVKPLAEFLSRQYPPQEMIMEPWLFTGSTHMLYAQRGIGKTFFGMQLALSVIHKKPFLGWNTVEPVNILYVDGEMPGPTMQKRFGMLTKNFAAEDMKSQIFILSSADLAFDGHPSVNLWGNAGKTWRETILNAVNQHDIKFVILDNLSALTPGIEENESSAWGEVGQWIGQVKHCGCAVMFVHHENKKGEQRGTSAREDALDCVIKLQRAEDAEEQGGINVDVVFTKHRNVEYIPRRNFTVESTGEERINCRGGEAVDPTLKKAVRIVELLVANQPRRSICDALNTSSKTVTGARKRGIDEGWVVERKGELVATAKLIEMRALIGPQNGEEWEF